MCKTPEGKKEYERRKKIGKGLSFLSFQKWVNMADRSFQYRKETHRMGIPSGRGHYFGEIRPSTTFLPVSKGEFEGLSVYLPGNADDYLSNLYGKDYLSIPSEEERERHFFVSIKFKEND